MFITTLHETSFCYDRPIRGTFTESRLWPVSDGSQTCKEFALSVDPLRPVTEATDYFGNKVMTFNILSAHDCVVVTGRSVVETHRNPFIPVQPMDPFEEQLARHNYLGFDGPIERGDEVAEVGISKLARDAGIAICESYAEIEQRNADELFAAMQKLNGLIFERFAYSPESTDVRTAIAQVFEQRKGVCQDFAHIFVAVCRAAGLPARYASGYLVTRRSRSAAGSTASHAWAEVLLPGYGWSAFDPTNNLLANDYYIKLASGRDYRDVPPTRGVYNGAGVQSVLRVRVHTIVHEDTADGVAEPSDRDVEREQPRYSLSPRELVG